MVDEEGVGGQLAVRPAPGSHAHPTHWLRGLGLGGGRGRRYLAAPSQPRCFTVAVLAGLGWRGPQQPLNTSRGPVPTASLVAPGDSQLGLRSFFRAWRWGSGWKQVPSEHSQGACDVGFAGGRAEAGFVQLTLGTA